MTISAISGIKYDRKISCGLSLSNSIRKKVFNDFLKIFGPNCMENHHSDPLNRDSRQNFKIIS